MYATSRLLIRPLGKKDTNYIVKWRNDPEITGFLFSSGVVTREEHLAWLGRLKDDHTRREFILVEKEKGLPIGTAGLSNLDFAHQKGELGILIGEKSCWGKGYAQEACRFIVNYGFVELDLNKIYLRADVANERAIQLYKKIGFKQEGLFKEEILKDSLFRDVVTMAMLKKEWWNYGFEN